MQCLSTEQLEKHITAVEYNPDLNIFMRCDELNKSALSELPDGYSLRHSRKDELSLWKLMHFDGKETAELLAYMDEWFDRVYAPQCDLFYKTCLFAVNRYNASVGTCLTWKLYGKFTTMHWFKVLPSYESRGIGRALLSEVMKRLTPEDYPVYLVTAHMIWVHPKVGL